LGGTDEEGRGACQRAPSPSGSRSRRDYIKTPGKRGKKGSTEFFFESIKSGVTERLKKGGSKRTVKKKGEGGERRHLLIYKEWPPGEGLEPL